MNDHTPNLANLIESCRRWEKAEGRPITQAQALQAMARDLKPMLLQPTQSDGTAESWPAFLEAVREALERFDLDNPGLDGMEVAEALARLTATPDYARHIDRLAAVREAPAVRWSATVRDEAEPAPILWRDNPGNTYANDPVVSAGECAVLAGAGAAGKSWLTIRLAVEAARAAKAGEPSGAACGLRVRAGPVIVVSYEMSPKRIDMAANAMDAPDGVPCLALPPPLFPMDPATRAHAESPDWRPVWDALARERPALIVFDTGPKAMGGADVNAGAPVIAFLQAVERELQALGECAALVICHDTKAMRDAAKDGEDMGAGAIAGSGQWYDSPRGVLHLAKVAGGDTRILECLKASNGREHWGARLAPLWNTPTGAPRSRYTGLQLDGDGALIEPGGMKAARKAAALAKAETTNGASERNPYDG